MSSTHLSETAFSSLDLHPDVLKGVESAGFEFCTPIQADALPIALAGGDVAGQAQTGTGKSAAFLLAMLNRLKLSQPSEGRKKNDPRAVILAPTRELAIQIYNDAVILNKGCGYTLCLAFGGTDYEKQRTAIENGCDILIGTPGRLIDYFKQKVFGLRNVDVLILDEADRMFDLGFIKDIRYVLRRMPDPDKRLNLMFSATLAQRVLELAYEHMNDPKLIRIEAESVAADRIKQAIYYPANDEKLRLLVGILRQTDAGRSMVFVNTKRAAELVQATLQANGFKALAISGDVPQKKRMSMLKQFQSGELEILVGTDVASRGLHIDNVSHVFNYDLPQDPEDYVHRIGRTARAGTYGEAISFGCENYAQGLPDIEKYVGYRLPMESVAQELLADITIPVIKRKRRPSGRGGGGRGGPRKPGGGPRRSGGNSRSSSRRRGGSGKPSN
ncbi:MAG: DEAD/DEAH box helicase [Gammaproteobacteria bacterium]